MQNNIRFSYEWGTDVNFFFFFFLSYESHFMSMFLLRLHVIKSFIICISGSKSYIFSFVYKKYPLSPLAIEHEEKKNWTIDI